jgi:acetyltransferase EpsM
LEEQQIEGRKTLKDRLQNIASFQGGIVPDIVSIDDYYPDDGENFIIGFSGYQMLDLRDFLVNRFGLNFTPLVHPTAYILPTVRTAPGCVINARAVIASNVKIEEHVFVNRNASIGHDSRLSRFSIVQPGANLAGHITVKEGAVIGIGASVIEDQTIGRHSVVAAGAVVTREVPPGVLVAGVPAIVKKQLYTVSD